MTTIPTYEDAQNRVVTGKGTMLDWFVTEHEPGGMVDQAKFRRELTQLLEERDRLMPYSLQWINLEAERDYWKRKYHDEFWAALDYETPKQQSFVAGVIVASFVFAIGVVLGMIF